MGVGGYGGDYHPANKIYFTLASWNLVTDFYGLDVAKCFTHLIPWQSYEVVVIHNLQIRKQRLRVIK